MNNTACSPEIVTHLRHLLERSRQKSQIAAHSYESVMLHAVTSDEIYIVRQQLKVDISGFRHMVDECGLKHVLKNHTSRNPQEHRPLVEDEILLIPTILLEFESLILSSRNRKNLITLTYCKKLQDGNYVEYIAEVRNKKRVLALTTMYKKPLRKYRRG